MVHNVQGPTPEASPSIRRKGSARRTVRAPPRKSAAFLDVPQQGGQQGADEDDEDKYRVRSFSFTSKGKFFENPDVGGNVM